MTNQTRNSKTSGQTNKGIVSCYRCEQPLKLANDMDDYFYCDNEECDRYGILVVLYLII